MHIRFVLVLLSLLCQSLGTEARPLRDNEIPPSLAPWVPWVLYEERDRECPFIHNQPEARRCAWPSRLVLKIDQDEGEFSLSSSGAFTAKAGSGCRAISNAGPKRCRWTGNLLP